MLRGGQISTSKFDPSRLMIATYIYVILYIYCRFARANANGLYFPLQGSLGWVLIEGPSVSFGDWCEI